MVSLIIFMHASTDACINFKRNLAFAQADLKSTKVSLSDIIEECTHINAGAFCYFRSRESDSWLYR